MLNEPLVKTTVKPWHILSRDEQNQLYRILAATSGRSSAEVERFFKQLDKAVWEPLKYKLAILRCHGWYPDFRRGQLIWLMLMKNKSDEPSILPEDLARNEGVDLADLWPQVEKKAA